MPAEKFSRYEIRDELGRGGTATVYRAYDPLFEREVALKILNRELFEDPQVRERFERETKIIAKLEHAAIVPVYDVGYDKDGRLFYVMRYMAGGSLSERIQNGPLTLNKIASIIIRIATALDYAHSKGIIHRDLKPGNILFDEDNNAYISDFGIAKFMQAATRITYSGIIGTPRYLSPEQAQGEEVDNRSDLYSLGIVLFEMLSGKTPFDGSTPLAVVFKQVTEPVPNILDINPNLPAGINDVLQKILAKDPVQRYRTGVEFVNAFIATITEVSLQDINIPRVISIPSHKNFEPHTELPQNIPPPKNQHNFRFLAISSVILLILIGIALWRFSQYVPIVKTLTPIPETGISATSAPSTLTNTPSETLFPTLTFTPTITKTFTATVEPTKTITTTATPTTIPILSISGNINFLLVIFPILIIGFGLYTYAVKKTDFLNGRLYRPKSTVSNAEEKRSPNISSTALTINALAALDPKKRKELLFIIGRDQELRLKHSIVYYGGGRYLLHGFGRFGASALIDQIVKLSQYELSQLNKEQDKGIIMTIRIDASTLEETDRGINAVIREFNYEAKHSNYARSFQTQVGRLYKNRLADVTNSTDEKTISIKAAPIPGIEAQFSRKFGNAGSSSKVTGEDLLKLIVDFLDHSEQHKPNSFELLVDKVLGNTTIPARMIFVIDRIKSEAALKTLKRMNLLNDDRISVFAIIRQENFLTWKKNDETLNLIQELNFQLQYVPCLWEEKSNFVDKWIDEAFPHKAIGEDKNILSDFKDHIAFISRGSPGDAVKASLNNDYCEYPFGTPKLNLTKIRNVGEIKTNANLQRILIKNWDNILSTRFKNATEEDEDQARRAIYKLVDWINSQIIFTLPDAQKFAIGSDLRISDSDPIVLNILKSLLTVLVNEKYLVRSNGKYGVSHRIVLEDLKRGSNKTAPKKKTNVTNKRIN